MSYSFSYSILIFFIIHHLLQISSFLSAAQTISSFSIQNSPWKPTLNITLVSPNSSFAAGFHPLTPSSKLYVFSVWYANISDHALVWSTKWDVPVQQTGSLTITSKGVLQLTNGSSSGPNPWPGAPPPPVGNNSTRLILRDDGKLVFGPWDSFQHPTDTILPTQSMNNTILTSRNGKFQFTGSKNLVYNTSDSYWTSANGFLSLGIDGRIAQAGADPLLTSDFGQNLTRRLVLSNDGNLRVFSFDQKNEEWVTVWLAVVVICQIHGLCGPGYICYSDGSTLSNYECVCPPGFRRSSTSNSCENEIPIIDTASNKFLRLDYVDYLDGSNQTDLQVHSFDHCQSNCLSNPKCLGFGFKFDGSGYCVHHLNRLLNGYWNPGTGSAFYLRVDKSETEPTNFTGMSEVLVTTCPVRISLPNPPEDSNETARNIIIIVILFTAEIASGVLLFRAFLKRYVKYRDMAQALGLGLLPTAGPRRFTLSEIKAATMNFSDDNVIGKGGFSDVYIGKLQDGRPVAVKCLKNVSGGDAEFWAEVTIIARMHHLNLVRLWGFCNEKGRRVLVYEHVPNGSLDRYLFRPSRIPGSNDEENNDDIGSVELQQKPVLDWNIRYRIAIGVARAIAYLHEECLEWVLHCDIKPENILLGDDFCPKVADFGLSKLRKKEQIVTMSRIRGTRGYLAPEWVNKETITSKVDVYSFGMVLLEIVSGVRNNSVQLTDMPSEEWYFPRWAFNMAIEEKRMDMILDRQIKHAYDDRVHFKLVDRMVKTAMWCVQEKPEMRPSMGKVAKMLEGTIEIIEPPKPTIFWM
ncbi:G-type lectin S-receptor-like serine/threonine-protein kinase At1g34300 [Silene latifolia]|uniref:G-type lectin S-receptor-like serine/threonine-protein kinase At1g34300 n=1 Tax=Silene latifolia TaxID=37657 RepID=UPI003D77D83B